MQQTATTEYRHPKLKTSGGCTEEVRGQVIVTMPVKGIMLVDDHYYKREQGMFEESKHYDAAERNGPRIFVGEWATREGSPTPNFGAAAVLTGLERNSDVVIISACGPKLVNASSAEQPIAITLQGAGTASRTAHGSARTRFG